MDTVSGRWEVSELVEYVEGLRANVLDVTASISLSVPDLFHVPFCHCTHNTFYHSTAVKSNRIQSIVCGVKHAHLARMHGVISHRQALLHTSSTGNNAHLQDPGTDDACICLARLSDFLNTALC